MKATEGADRHGRGCGRRLLSGYRRVRILLSVCCTWSVVSAGAESLLDWQVCGPFESRSVLAPVVADEAAISPAADVAGRGWKRVVSAAAIVDLQAADALGNQDRAVAFARAEIDFDAESDLRLGIGSDDAVMAWWNGELVLVHDILRGTTPGEDQVRVRARPGKNVLLLKVYDEAGGWSFAVDVRREAP